MNETQARSAIDRAIARAQAYSPFLRLQLERFPELASHLAGGDLDAALLAARVEAGTHDEMAAIRRERSGFALALGIGDLAGLLPLERVTAELSSLAERLLERALAHVVAERTPDEPVRGFAVIALGKLGGHELNYSSDVDLIFLYDPDTLPRRTREEPGQAAMRIGQDSSSCSRNGPRKAMPFASTCGFGRRRK